MRGPRGREVAIPLVGVHRTTERRAEVCLQPAAHANARVLVDAIVPRSGNVLEHGVYKCTGAHAPAPVAFDSRPERPIEQCAHSRPASRASIVIGGANTVQVVADVPPPLIRELGVCVDVAANAGEQATGVPLCPLIEVHKRPAIPARRRVVLQPHPVVVRLLVCAREKAEVVDLEPRRGALEPRPEARHTAAHLVDARLHGVAAE